MSDQLQKQANRLRELRIKKVEEPGRHKKDRSSWIWTSQSIVPDAFWGTEDIALQNVDVMTDVSMPATAFTRYTVAPTSASRTSK